MDVQNPRQALTAIVVVGAMTFGFLTDQLYPAAIFAIAVLVLYVAWRLVRAAERIAAALEES